AMPRPAGAREPPERAPVKAFDRAQPRRRPDRMAGEISGGARAVRAPPPQPAGDQHEGRHGANRRRDEKPTRPEPVRRGGRQMLAGAARELELPVEVVADDPAG